MLKKNSNNHKKFLHFLNSFKHLQIQVLFHSAHHHHHLYFLDSHKKLTLLAFSTIQINFYKQHKNFSHFFHQSLNNRNLKNIPKYCIHKILLLVPLQKDLLYFIIFRFCDYHTMFVHQDHLILSMPHLILLIFFYKIHEKEKFK